MGVTYQVSVRQDLLAMLVLRIVFSTLAVSVSLSESGPVTDYNRASDVRDNRVRRSSQRNVCESKKQIISPIVAQNIEGRLKFLVQENTTHSRVQELEISVCVGPGTHCTHCINKNTPGNKNRVCGQMYKEHRLLAKGNYLMDKPKYDLFMFPDGC